MTRSDAARVPLPIGELFEQRLNDAYRAVEVYGEILGALPEHTATQVALERMIAAGKELSCGTRTRADLSLIGEH